MNFWDTSAIVPLCVQEPASALVRDALIEDEGIVVWWGTRTECISALMRQVREGGLTPRDERNARHVLDAKLDRDATEWDVTQHGRTIAGRASVTGRGCVAVRCRPHVVSGGHNRAGLCDI